MKQSYSACLPAVWSAPNDVPCCRLCASKLSQEETLMLELNVKRTTLVLRELSGG